jgi:uncharacterized protein with HEPN domain
MFDNEIMILSTLNEIKFSIELILKRFKKINSPDDFMNEENLETLDSISMRLIAIGEGFKNIDKLTNNNFLINYPSINWKGVKGIRDILSHHYFDINSEIIFNLCDTKLNELLNVVNQMREDIIYEHTI